MKAQLKRKSRINMIAAVINAKLDYAFRRLLHRAPINLPLQVGKYRFVRHMDNGPFKRYLVGLYEDASGNRAFAKQWDGSRNIMDHYWLHNEISIYRELHLLYQREGDEIKKQFPAIRVPRLLTVESDRCRLLVLTQLEQGVKLSDLPVETRVEAIECVIKYFQEIGARLIQHGTPSISRRSMLYVVLMFPVTFLKLLLRHPVAWAETCAGTFHFIRLLPSLMRRSTYTFVHRDLSPANAFHDKGYVIPLDFEFSVFTHPLIEMTNAVARVWENREMRAALYKSPMMREVLGDSSLLAQYKALSLYTALVDLSNSGDAAEISSAKSFLRHSMSLQTANV